MTLLNTGNLPNDVAQHLTRLQSSITHNPQTYYKEIITIVIITSMLSFTRQWFINHFNIIQSELLTVLWNKLYINKYKFISYCHQKKKIGCNTANMFNSKFQWNTSTGSKVLNWWWMNRPTSCQYKPAFSRGIRQVG